MKLGLSFFPKGCERLAMGVGALRLAEYLPLAFQDSGSVALHVVLVQQAFHSISAGTIVVSDTARTDSNSQ